MIEGIVGDAFSAATLTQENLAETEMNDQKIIKVSRERYKTKKSVLEEKIKERERTWRIVSGVERDLFPTRR